MKLLRYGPTGQEKPGILDQDGNIRDLSGIVQDIAGEALSPESLEQLRSVDPAALSRVEGDPRIGPCVGQVGKFICIGLNYSDHAAESGMAVPPEPIIFMKATSAICGPNDGIEMPRGSEKTDWEVELGIVIGKTAKYVDEAQALEHVAGYCVINDVSERSFQIERSETMDQGQERRHLRTHWPLARHAGRNRQSAESGHVAGGGRQTLPEWQHGDHGLRGCISGELPEPVHEPSARRCDRDRDAAGRRHGHEAACLSSTWQSRAIGHRWAWPAGTTR
jgi:hypothetical protein